MNVRTPADDYKQLLREVRVELRHHGFAGRGSTFTKRRDGNWGVINFQRSSKSDRNQVVFTINVGVLSATISAVIEPEVEPRDPPEIEDCQWNERIGFLLPEGQDKWWVIDRGTDLDRLSAELTAVVREVAVPAVEEVLDDRGLALFLQRGATPGPDLPELDRLEYLTVLLKRLGDEQALGRAVEELRAATDKLHAPQEELESHLARLARMSRRGG